MNICKMLWAYLRIIPIIVGVDWSDEKLLKDIERWKIQKGITYEKRTALAILLHTYPEFRNLFIYRNRFRKIYRSWIYVWYKPVNSLFIQAREIGGGLFIQHGFATMISAEEIGENCWINQQVTIGYSNKGNRSPVIGNNVMITCGAKVLGPIIVGNDAIIGANAVVVHDVEAGAVMGGIPAKRIN